MDRWPARRRCRRSAGIGRSSRRRRPSGRPPPLPHPLHTTGVGWLTAAVVLMVLSVLVFGGGLRGPAVPVTAVDDAVVGWIAGLDGPGCRRRWRCWRRRLRGWRSASLLWGLLLALLITRRLRHLLVVVIAWTLQGLIIQYVLGPSLRRPRPFGVVFRTDWYAWALPSEQMAALAVTLVGILYGLVPEGRWRQAGKWSAAAVLAAGRRRSHAPRGGRALRCDRRGRDRGDDPVARIPSVHPERRLPGHLPSAGAPPTWTSAAPAAQAIRRALEDQLGLIVEDGRTVRSGRLGGFDAAAHQGRRRPGRLAVRQALRPQPPARRPLVQARPGAAVRPAGGREAVPHRPPAGAAGGLRAAQAAPRRAAHTPARTASSSSPPSGSTCSSPSSSTDATELGEAEIDDRVIDDGLSLIRKLWDAGLAHRDIKPANLLVRDGRLVLIDVAFVQARPSPWRQAVDLANMMLCLALRSGSASSSTSGRSASSPSPRSAKRSPPPAASPCPRSCAGCSATKAGISTPNSSTCCPPGPGRSGSNGGAPAESASCC